MWLEQKTTQLMSEHAGNQNGSGWRSEGDWYRYQQVLMAGILIFLWQNQYPSDNWPWNSVGQNSMRKWSRWRYKKQIKFLMKKEIIKFILPGSMWFSSHEVNLGYWRAWQHDQCLQGVLITWYWLLITSIDFTYFLTFRKKPQNYSEQEVDRTIKRPLWCAWWLEATSSRLALARRGSMLSFQLGLSCVELSGDGYNYNWCYISNCNL